MKRAKEIVIKDILAYTKDVHNRKVFNDVDYEWLTDNRLLIVLDKYEKVIHLSCNQMVEITLEKVEK